MRVPAIAARGRTAQAPVVDVVEEAADRVHHARRRRLAGRLTLAAAAALGHSSSTRKARCLTRPSARHRARHLVVALARQAHDVLVDRDGRGDPALAADARDRAEEAVGLGRADAPAPSGARRARGSPRSSTDRGQEAPRTPG
ncbi:MAG: hypothetical protein K2X91_05990, partial [Thermoleophilia bacterium]|nr:hypothetical protein [Thermoleophilia bacterium]